MKTLADAFLRAVLPRAGSKFRDPLGRKEGESLDPLRFTAAQLEHKKRALGPRTWGSVWQQDPVTEGGNLLHRSVFKNKEQRRLLSYTEFLAATEGLPWVRFWDFAYTAQQINKADPDFTVGARMAFKMEKWGQRFDIYLWDVVRFRKGWNDVKIAVREQAWLDGPDCWIGGEANGPQSAAVQDIASDPALHDYHVVGLQVPSEKVAKAQLWTSRANDGLMWICDDAELDRKWTLAFYEEVEAFPNGTHDDIVDAVSGGYVLAGMRMTAGNARPTAGTVKGINSRW